MTKITRKIRKMWKDKTGVSPIIAVILMVAITVVLAATIYAWVSGFGGGGGGGFTMSIDQMTSWTGTTADFRVLSVRGNASWTNDMGATIGISSATINAYGDDYVDAGDIFSVTTSSTVSVGSELTLINTAEGNVVATVTIR